MQQKINCIPGKNSRKISVEAGLSAKTDSHEISKNIWKTFSQKFVLVKIISFKVGISNLPSYLFFQGNTTCTTSRISSLSRSTLLFPLSRSF